LETCRELPPATEGWPWAEIEDRRWASLPPEVQQFIKANGLEREYLDFEHVDSSMHESQIARMPAYEGLSIPELNDVFRKAGARGEVFNENPAAQLFMRREIAVTVHMDELRAGAASWQQKCAELEKRTEDLDTALYKEQTLRGAAEREVEELREKLRRKWKLAEEISGDTVSGIRHAAEVAALRSQLALAEERRRPARHRPGAVVNVGWDPEGD
jgi:hypothetical protein